MCRFVAGDESYPFMLLLSIVFYTFRKHVKLILNKIREHNTDCHIEFLMYFIHKMLRYIILKNFMKCGSGSCLLMKYGMMCLNI